MKQQQQQHIYRFVSLLAIASFVLSSQEVIADSSSSSTITTTVFTNKVVIPVAEKQSSCTIIDGQCELLSVPITITTEEGRYYDEEDVFVVDANGNGGRHDVMGTKDPSSSSSSSVWESGGIWELSDAIGCSDDNDDEDGMYSYSHIHDTQAWKIFNKAYHAALTVTKPTIPTEYGGDGFQVPVEIKFTPGVGRGVFAKVPIQKGTIIWKPLNTAQFETGNEFRTFLRSLPPKFACDVLIWAYTIKVSSSPSSSVASDNNNNNISSNNSSSRTTAGQRYYICVDLDPGTLFNTASDPSEENVVEISDDPSSNTAAAATSCLGDTIYASRDIVAGEGKRRIASCMWMEGLCLCCHIMHIRCCSPF